MTNREWVRLDILSKAVSSYLFLWPQVCEQYCTFGCETECHCIFSHDQQGVSDIQVHYESITSFSYVESQGVSDIALLWKADSFESHLFLLPTACEWHCTFCEGQSHHIFVLWPTACEWHCHFVKCSLTGITSFPMTNRKCVILLILQKAVSSHLFLCPTGSEQHCTFYEGSLITSFPFDQQQVSDSCKSSDLHSQHTLIHECLINITSYLYQRVSMLQCLFLGLLLVHCYHHRL